MRNAPLGTARDASYETLRAVNRTPFALDKPTAHEKPAIATSVHLAWLQASVLEQDLIDRDRAGRAEIAEAISRAERGDELSILDIDLDDVTQRTEYDRALIDVQEERARRDRAAASLLAVKRLRGKAPR